MARNQLVHVFVTGHPPCGERLLAVHSYVGGRSKPFERHHQRRRERPRLGAEVSQLPHFDADLLPGLATAGVLQILAGLHESRGNGIQPGIAPCAVVLQQQAVLMVDDRRDHSRFHTGEQQSPAIRFVGATLGPAAERRFGQRSTGRAVALTRMPHTQRDGGGRLTGLTGVGMRCEGTQIHPVEAFRGGFKERWLS